MSSIITWLNLTHFIHNLCTDKLYLNLLFYALSFNYSRHCNYILIILGFWFEGCRTIPHLLLYSLQKLTLSSHHSFWGIAVKWLYGRFYIYISTKTIRLTWHQLTWWSHILKIPGIPITPFYKFGNPFECIATFYYSHNVNSFMVHHGATWCIMVHVPSKFEGNRLGLLRRFFDTAIDWIIHFTYDLVNFALSDNGYHTFW